MHNVSDYDNGGAQNLYAGDVRVNCMLATSTPEQILKWATICGLVPEEYVLEALSIQLGIDEMFASLAETIYGLSLTTQ